MFIFQHVVFVSYIVHSLLIPPLVIDMCTSLLGLNNERGHTESKAVVAPDLGWNPTTYKDVPYYSAWISENTNIHTHTHTHETIIRVV